MPPKKKTEAEAAAAAPAASAAEAAPKEPKAKKEKVAKEPKEAKESTEPTRRSTRIKDLPAKPDPTSLTPALTKKKRRGDNKNDPDNMEYKPGGGASGRKGGKKRKKAAAKEDDDDEADEEEKPKKKLKSEVSPPTNWLTVRDGVPRTCCRPKYAARVAGNYHTSYRLFTGASGESLARPPASGSCAASIASVAPQATRLVSPAAS